MVCYCPVCVSVPSHCVLVPCSRNIMKSAALDLRDWGGYMNCSAVPSWCGVRKQQILAQDCASLGGVIPIKYKKIKKWV